MRPLVLSAAILVGIGPFAGACESAGDLPDPSPASPTPASGTPGGIVDPNRELAAIAEEVPGFASYWRDPATGAYKINSTDPNINVEAVKAAILKRDPSLVRAFENARFEVVPVEFDASQLNAWYQEMIDVVISGLPNELRTHLNYYDLDELHNRILVAFTSEEARAWAQEQIAEKIDAPLGVIVVIVEPQGQDD